MRHACLLLTLAAVQPAVAQVTDLRYELRFDSSTAKQRTLEVTTTFRVGAAGPVLFSLPSWTPGAYEVANFARHVRNFSARQGTTDLAWDKRDYDTWRIRPTRAGEVTLQFSYYADDLDNARSWARNDFLMVNGTNVFLYPEGQGFDFPATVTVKTATGWRAMTGMKESVQQGREQSGPVGEHRFGESNYHDLVDKPFFIGRLDVDSAQAGGKWYRVASWPSGIFQGAARKQFHDEVAGAVPPMVRVFGEQPWDAYTTLLLFDSTFGGGSALEHANSHVGIYSPEFMGSVVLASITAHEIFHAWNVKRLRPVEMFPYRYDVPQETVWLWVSEGITDYYADLALVRGGVVDSSGFAALIQRKVDETYDSPPVALEDASLSAWISPDDGSASVYYPKGALAGFLLDILIRDASNNAGSLDDVLGGLYRKAWKTNRGFTAEDWWGAVSAAAGGKRFGDFARRYIDGREEFPWAEVLPQAGFQLAIDSVREPRIGIRTSGDGPAPVVEEVSRDGMGDEAGIIPGDKLIKLGDVDVVGPRFGLEYRQRYARERPGLPIPIVVERAGQRLTLQGKLRLVTRVERRLGFLPNAGEKAVRIRTSLLRG
jgi:predicted metalloprotease with PDZ domain